MEAEYASQDVQDDVASMELAEELEAYGELFEADAGDLPIAARRALTGLLSKPYVSAETEPDLYALVLAHEQLVRRDLNNLGLTLTVSERYGVAWASQASMEGKSPLYVLKRSVGLRRDQTVLLVRLRVRQHTAETRGEERWFVDRDELVDEVVSLLYPNDKNHARAVGNVDRALDDLVSMGYLRRVRAVEGRYQITPVLPAALSLEHVQEMLGQMEELVGADPNDPDETAGEA